MKWVLIILLNVCFWCCLKAQTSTFNIHNAGGLDQSVGCAGIEVDGYYWSVSRGFLLNEGGYRLSFLQVDDRGEVIGNWQTEVFPGIIQMDHTNHLVLREDKIFGVARGGGLGILWSFNVDTKEFLIEYSDEDDIELNLGKLTSLRFNEFEDNFVISGYSLDENIIAKIFIIDFNYITKTANKREIRGMELDVLGFEFIKNYSNNLLILGYQRYLLNNGEISTKIVLQEINNQDSVIWKYITPKSYVIVRDALYLNDKLVVVSTTEYEDEMNPDKWRSVVICVDTELKAVIWTNRISPDYYSTFALLWNRMLMAPDSSGIILAGQQIAPNDDEEFRRWGAAAKISFEGDSIWYRTYHNLDGQNEIEDMEHTLDGGYIMTGTSVYHTYPGPDTTWFNTWMLKTDGEGRLIPDTTSTVTYEQDDIDYHIRVYPNPTSDQLYIEHEQAEQYQYTLRDSQGRVTKEWYDEQSGGAVSYILDTHDYTSGVYYLSIYLDGEVVTTQKVVIQ